MARARGHKIIFLKMFLKK